eukprot:Gb_14660 [translate_table: standard]
MKDGDLVILVVYADDLVITGNSLKLIDEVKGDLGKAFEMTDLGLLHYCLGIEVWKDKVGIFISQTKHAKELLKKFRMEDCKPADTPMETGLKLTANEESKKVDETLYRQLVGTLIYLTYTRPDISFVVNFISRFMTAPKVSH